MSTTLTRPPVTRQPYYRQFAGRTARWTLVLTTAFVGGQYVAMVFGLTGGFGAFVGGVTAMALGTTAAAGTDGHRWAAALTGLVWGGWLLVGHVHHGWANLRALAGMVAVLSAVVGVALALVDLRAEMRANR
jgi:hypothetical protein